MRAWPSDDECSWDAKLVERVRRSRLGALPTGRPGAFASTRRLPSNDIEGASSTVNISHLIELYGYFAVFILVGAESLGIPLPGETALIVAAAYAGHTHRLSPWVIFAVAVAGAVIGDNIGFWIGHRFGYPLARKYGRHVWLNEGKLKIGRYVFDAHGQKVVFFGRFVSILRTYAAFLAGSSRMRWNRFLPANAAGAIVWAGTFTLAAYMAGNAITHQSGMIDLVIGGVALFGVATILLVVGRQTNRLGPLAEAAYPGPLE